MSSDPKPKSRPPSTGRRLSPLDLLLLAAWCGPAAGELEVAARMVHASLSSTNRLYLMTRHFVWVVPLLNGLLFLVMGAFWAVAVRIWPRRAGWLGPRFLATLTILPALVIAGPSIYTAAWLVLALGTASWVSAGLERDPARARRWLALSLPVLLGCVLVQAFVVVGGDRARQWREQQRPLPPAGSPNVLLIVLDTVRADRLGLYGYERPTSRALERLAARGVRFDQARAAAPWTLASHATMFTGRWPHELGIRWLHPLRGGVPTLAEFLGGLGYATAGFVGNTFYCSYDSGLDRGFGHYEDYVFDDFQTVRTSQLVNGALQVLLQVGPALLGASSRSMGGWFLRRLAIDDSKTAEAVNREFLGWLSRRDPRRPFFAFLNYADAHAPYVLPPGIPYRFGAGPRTEGDFLFLLEGWFRLEKQRTTPAARTLVRDAYDDCLAYLDDRLAEMLDDLGRRGLMENTLVIVAADHGEGLGEHDLFDHGQSLYRTEIRVPLVIVPPGGRPTPKVVGEFASLRDIPATIAELVAPGTSPTFPGRSLARFWREPSAPVADDLPLSELSAPNPSDPNKGRSPAYRGPLVSLAEGNYVYIRNEGDGREELFDERDDPRELMDRARAPGMIPVLRRFRDRLGQLKPAAR